MFCIEMTMSRPPRARKQVLDAAERIVKAHGAANLTFEELVQESGISRGGITYHFATKDDLLRALGEGLPGACKAATAPQELLHAT